MKHSLHRNFHIFIFSMPIRILLLYHFIFYAMQYYNIHYNFYTNNNIFFDTYRSIKGKNFIKRKNYSPICYLECLKEFDYLKIYSCVIIFVT